VAFFAFKARSHKDEINNDGANCVGESKESAFELWDYAQIRKTRSENLLVLNQKFSMTFWKECILYRPLGGSIASVKALPLKAEKLLQKDKTPDKKKRAIQG
jgi:hypothetical protein